MANDLVVNQGHQDQIFGYYQVSLHDVNRACELTIIVNAFLKRKKKYLVLFLPSELANHPSADIVPNHLVVYLELILLDEPLLDIVLDGDDLSAIILQNIRTLDERVLEP